MEDNVNVQGQVEQQDQADVLPSDREVVPNDEEVIKTLEEQLAELTAARDQAIKDHSELEKLMGRKAQEAGDKKREEEEAAKQAERQNTQQEYIKSIVDDVVSSGMVISEEVSTKLAELGISNEIVQLEAYKYKDKIDSVVKVFGDRETYDKALVFGAELGLTQDQLAAHGLKALYSNTNGEPTQAVADTRIMGVSQSRPQVKGFSSMQEYSAYKKAAGNNPDMIKSLQERANKTDWEALGVVM